MWYNKSTKERTKKERKNMKYYSVGYKRNEVCQSILVQAESEEHALQFFKGHKPDAEIYGATEVIDITEDLKKGKPIITAE